MICLMRELSVLKWCVETDTFGFKVDVKLKPPTRRGILSVVSSVYDPLGLAIPFVFPAKLLLQDLCRVKLDWDGPIPQKHKVPWERWIADLRKLSQFSVDCCVKPAGFYFISSRQLHHFSDAAETGLGSVSYLRLVNGQGAVYCSFLCAKSCVASRKEIWCDFHMPSNSGRTNRNRTQFRHGCVLVGFTSLYSQKGSSTQDALGQQVKLRQRRVRAA